MPAEQLLHADCLIPENSPSEQFWHVLRPVAFWNRFSSQSRHAVWPALATYVPTKHSEQLGAAPIASHWLAFHALMLPGRQSRQVVAFLAG